MEPIRIETTVDKDGILAIPLLKKGDKVEVIVLRQAHEKEAEKPKRTWGWAKGWVHIGPDFDDPIPGMEEYM